MGWPEFAFAALMLTLYAVSLMMVLAASSPVRAGVLLLLGTALATSVGVRYLGVDAYAGILALILNGFFGLLFIVVGGIMQGIRIGLRGGIRE